jgi:hypothetical protein
MQSCWSGMEMWSRSSSEIKNCSINNEMSWNYINVCGNITIVWRYGGIKPYTCIKNPNGVLILINVLKTFNLRTIQTLK